MDIISYAMGKQAGGTAPTGSIDITTNGEHDVSNYATANVNVPGVGDYYLNELTGNGVKYLIKKIPTFSVPNTITGLNSCFDSCGNLTEVEGITNTSQVTNVSGMFSYCSKMTTVPLFDTSNVTNFFQMFQVCSELVSVPQYDTSKGTDLSRMFYSCKKLETVPILDFSSATNLANMFNDCMKLSNESVNNIMASCITATNYTGTKTLRQLAVPMGKRQIAPTLSNYQAFLDAGWTTGD